MLRITNAVQTLDRLRPFASYINLKCLRKLVCALIWENAKNFSGQFISHICKMPERSEIECDLWGEFTVNITALDNVYLMEWGDLVYKASGRVRVTVS